ncbi:MAG: type III toxin-antitoxin system ToxN/AbiQ family toxin [Clostridiales bacterium]|nr:type III toxin-antitoxin system ToxN/AbiQ family toxin [Clostridiales bacterium]
MDKVLKFYEVDASYIKYLSKFDSKVPKVDYSASSQHDKFLCGIVLSINRYNYFAPISSFIIPQLTNIIIKNERGEDLSSIRFSFMIPIPDGVATIKNISREPSEKYRRLLNWELRFCMKNANAIFRKAKHVYNTVICGKDPLMIKNCYDFKTLEAACFEYMSITPSADA